MPTRKVAAISSPHLKRVGPDEMHAAVEGSLSKIASRLMARFSSSQGYKLFDDALPARMS